MTVSEYINKNHPHGCAEWEFEEALKEFAKIKCQELLEIVAKKARIINEDGYE